MHKGINTTVDEGQTPIVTTGGVFSESSAFGGNNTSGPVEVATTCLANKSPHGRMDFASETFVVEPPTPTTTGHPDPAYAISAGQQGKGGVFGSGRDSQDTFVVESKAVAFQSTLGTRGGDIYEDGTAPTVRVGPGLGIPSPPAVAFKPGQSEAAGGTFVTDEYAPTLQSQSNGSTAVPAVAFKPSHFTRGKDGKPDEITPPLSADADKGDQDTVVLGGAVGFNWQNGGGYGNANDGLGITEEGTGPLQRCNTPAVAFVKATNPHSAEEAPRFEEANVAACLNGWDERHDPPKHVGAFKESQSGCRTGDVHATIDAHKGSRRQEGVMAFAQNQLGEVRTNGEAMGTVNTNQNASGRNTAMVHHAMQVRRLTPTECCRLQGFPDDRCDIEFRKKPAADGPKYRALGNSMAVPCMMWLGYRIHNATNGDNV
jgi:DNA (cytosine-5)-methyltransferase 1